jgi:ribosomal protein S18 acetylase RimI-like enzyme
MHAYTLRPYTHTPKDAAKLALLWNESKAQWPGISGRVGAGTDDAVHDWIGQEQGLLALVADDLTQDRFIGFGSMQAEPHEERSCHVSVISVHPAVQADELTRQMLTHMVDRAGTLGYHRVSLNTPSANLKSVPLYEAVGFFHLPDARPRWRNYVPLVRELPVSQHYFRQHDWCATLRRDSNQADHEGRPVAGAFRYHWKAGGEALLITIDRESETIIGVETERFAAHVEVDELRPSRALSYSIRWRIRNKAAQLLNVSVFADGDRGIRIAHRSALILSGGEEQMVKGHFTVAPDLFWAGDGGPVSVIRTVLVVGAQIVELGTGVRPRQAMSVGPASSSTSWLSDGQPVLQQHRVPQRQPA